LVLCAKKNLATLFSSRNGDVNQKYPSASWWLPSITAWLQITGSPRSVELNKNLPLRLDIYNFIGRREIGTKALFIKRGGGTELLRHKDLLKRSE
jgi:hypothetical protein